MADNAWLLLQLQQQQLQQQRLQQQHLQQQQALPNPIDPTFVQQFYMHQQQLQHLQQQQHLQNLIQLQSPHLIPGTPSNERAAEKSVDDSNKPAQSQSTPSNERAAGKSVDDSNKPAQSQSTPSNERAAGKSVEDSNKPAKSEIPNKEKDATDVLEVSSTSESEHDEEVDNVKTVSKKRSPDENVNDFLKRMKGDTSDGKKKKKNDKSEVTVSMPKGCKKMKTVNNTPTPKGRGRPLGSLNKTASKDSLKASLENLTSSTSSGPENAAGTRRSSRLSLVNEVGKLKEMGSLRDVKRDLDAKERESPAEDDIEEVPVTSKSSGRLNEMKDNLRECILSDANTTWEDVYGLESVKKNMKDIIVLPRLRPDLFKPGSLREPSRAILLYGPPGTGKTMLGKCVATSTNSTFISIKASDLTSKWIGEGEKYVSAMFQLGEECKPSVLFIDEIDSLLTKRSDTEHEASRKIKTEFLSCMDGVKGLSKDVLILGTTNRPYDLDSAVLRRFTKQIYVPLPNCDDRKRLFRELLFSGGITVDISDSELQSLAEESDGYSSADISVLCKAAAQMPVTSLTFEEALLLDEDSVRPVNSCDVQTALRQHKRTCPPEVVKEIENWIGDNF